MSDDMPAPGSETPQADEAERESERIGNDINDWLYARYPDVDWDSSGEDSADLVDHLKIIVQIAIAHGQEEAQQRLVTLTAESNGRAETLQEMHNEARRFLERAESADARIQQLTAENQALRERERETFRSGGCTSVTIWKDHDDVQGGWLWRGGIYNTIDEALDAYRRLSPSSTPEEPRS